MERLAAATGGCGRFLLRCLLVVTLVCGLYQVYRLATNTPHPKWPVPLDMISRKNANNQNIVSMEKTHGGNQVTEPQVLNDLPPDFPEPAPNPPPPTAVEDVNVPATESATTSTAATTVASDTTSAEVTSAGTPTGPDSRNTSTIRNKLIIIWFRQGTKRDMGVGTGTKPFTRKRNNCRVQTCETTTSHDRLREADAVVVHTRPREFAMRPETYPTRVRRSQIFAFYNFEAPIRTKNLKLHADVFNLTMTYRTDSDIVIPYWYYKKRPASEPYVPLTPAQLKSKNKMAVWFFSSCVKGGNIRWQYVMELRKYIDIDIYGKCGNLSCPKDQHLECMKMAESNYKFYLSFENANCRDYMTEKVYNPLSINIVGIVMGGVDYHSKALPPHSVIDVSMFKNPRSLAEYLNYLDKSDDEYLKYFEWKKEYVVTKRDPDKGFCRLCEILHDDSYEYKSKFDVQQWWNVEGRCKDEDEWLRQFRLRQFRQRPLFQ